MSIMKNIFAAAGAAVVGAFVLGMVSDRILSETLSDDDAHDENECPRKRCDRCCDCDDDYDEDDYDEEDEDADEEDFEGEDDLPEPDIIIICRGFVHDDDEDKDDTDISVIAGRPGAGKTLWAAREAVDCLRDPNNVVFYIGFDQEFDRICRMVRSKYGANPHGRLLFALQDGAGEAIGKAIDIANLGTPSMMKENAESEEYQNNRPMVFLFYDQCRHDIFNGRRELLRAAAKAGVHVYVLCQKFSQIDRNDVTWLNTYCNPYVVSKMRDPRPATDEEISEKFR